RLKLQPRGITFSGRRAADEQQAEFLAGTDNWFRPVQMRTGPDGALWVVDMYRLVIEHPQWIPPEDLARLDVRAGHHLGRIYRIYPKDAKPRPMVRLDKLSAEGLVAALDSPNGPQRDLAQAMLLWNKDKSAVPLLQAMAASHARAEARLHALCTLDGLEALRAEDVRTALVDRHAGLRRHAVRLSERFLAHSPEVADAVLKTADDPDAQVGLQCAYSLGEWQDARASRALAALALRNENEALSLAGVLSSVNKANIGEIAANVLAEQRAGGGPQRLTETLLVLTASFGDRAA